MANRVLDWIQSPSKLFQVLDEIRLSGRLVLRRLDYLEATMATQEQIKQLTEQTGALVENVTKLTDVITTETAQQAERAQANATTLEALKQQLGDVADPETAANIEKLQAGNTAITESIRRVQNIVPDAQTAVDAATQVSDAVSAHIDATSDQASDVTTGTSDTLGGTSGVSDTLGGTSEAVA